MKKMTKKDVEAVLKVNKAKFTFKDNTYTIDCQGDVIKERIIQSEIGFLEFDSTEWFNFIYKGGESERKLPANRKRVKAE